MAEIKQTLNLGDLLKYEDEGFYSRDRATLTAGQPERHRWQPTRLWRSAARLRRLSGRPGRCTDAGAPRHGGPARTHMACGHHRD